MKLPKILTKIFWHEDYRRLYQDETKTKKLSQRQTFEDFTDLTPETFDALTPEDKSPDFLVAFYKSLILVLSE